MRVRESRASAKTRLLKPFLFCLALSLSLSLAAAFFHSRRSDQSGRPPRRARVGHGGDRNHSSLCSSKSSLLASSIVYAPLSQIVLRLPPSLLSQALSKAATGLASLRNFLRRNAVHHEALERIERRGAARRAEVRLREIAKNIVKRRTRIYVRRGGRVELL